MEIFAVVIMESEQTGASPQKAGRMYSLHDGGQEECGNYHQSI